MFIHVHHRKIKTQSPKQKKQHCNINDKTPSHHPLIIKTSQHHQHTSRRLHRNMPETSPTNNASLKDPQNTIKKPTQQPRDITKKDRTETETSQRHRQKNNTETRQRQDQDKTDTRPRQDRGITETRKHHRSTYGPQLH